jgi:ABC-type transporter Mla MlaB component
MPVRNTLKKEKELISLTDHLGKKKEPISYLIRPVNENQQKCVKVCGIFEYTINYQMENAREETAEISQPLTDLPDSVKAQLDPETKISNNVMSIRLSTDGLIIKDESTSTNPNEEDQTGAKLAGVYCQGVQYYDLKGVHYINNTGMAILIDLLKSLLEMGVEVQFVNVDEKIKAKIKEMGLERIINCGEKKNN